MILSDKYLMTEVYDSYVLFPVGQGIVEGRKPLKINKEGFMILNYLKNDISFDELLEKFMKEIEATNDERAQTKKLLLDYLQVMSDNSVLVFD